MSIIFPVRRPFRTEEQEPRILVQPKLFLQRMESGIPQDFTDSPERRRTAFSGNHPLILSCRISQDPHALGSGIIRAGNKEICIVLQDLPADGTTA